MSTSPGMHSPEGPASVSGAPNLPTGFREGYAEVGDDVRLHYVEGGEGPLIVLLHGFPEFWYGWRLQFEPLVVGSDLHSGCRRAATESGGFSHETEEGGATNAIQDICPEPIYDAYWDTAGTLRIDRRSRRRRLRLRHSGASVRDHVLDHRPREPGLPDGAAGRHQRKRPGRRHLVPRTTSRIQRRLPPEAQTLFRAP